MGSKTDDTDTLLEAIKDGYGAAVSSKGDGLLRRDLSTDEVRNLVFRLDALLRAGVVASLTDEQAGEVLAIVDKMLEQLVGTTWGAFGAAELSIGRWQLESFKLAFEEARHNAPATPEAKYEAFVKAHDAASKTGKDGDLGRDVSTAEVVVLVHELDALTERAVLSALSEEQLDDVLERVDVLLSALAGASGSSFGLAELAIGRDRLELAKLALEHVEEGGKATPVELYERFKAAYDAAFATKRDGFLWRDVSTSEARLIIHHLRQVATPDVIAELSKKQVVDIVERDARLLKELSGTAATALGAVELSIAKDHLHTLKLKLDESLGGD